MKKTYTVSGMHCDSCAFLIEEELSDAGIKAVCSYKTNTLEVDFDTIKTSETELFSHVKKVGYTLSPKK